MKAPALTEGGLAETLTEAIRLRERARNEGATEAELDATMERTLRAAWPQVREWKYLCSACQDTGLVTKLCRRGDRCNGTSSRADTPHDPPGKYQRLCAMEPLSDYQHEYGTPCTCAKGHRFRQTPKGRPEDFTDQAGAAKRKPTRFGR
jgi:hypothetical protein